MAYLYETDTRLSYKEENAFKNPQLTINMSCFSSECINLFKQKPYLADQCTFIYFLVLPNSNKTAIIGGEWHKIPLFILKVSSSSKISLDEHVDDVNTRLVLDVFDVKSKHSLRRI